MITVWCTTEFESLHCWPEAKGEVEYLRYPHRHIFKVKLEVEVDELNREVEFITLKKDLINFCEHKLVQKNYPGVGEQTNQRSCEMMCQVIATWSEKKGYKPTSVTVSEDGENGATWHRD